MYIVVIVIIERCFLSLDEKREVVVIVIIGCNILVIFILL